MAVAMAVVMEVVMAVVMEVAMAVVMAVATDTAPVVAPGHFATEDVILVAKTSLSEDHLLLNGHF
jgi:hypothetical protein